MSVAMIADFVPRRRDGPGDFRQPFHVRAAHEKGGLDAKFGQQFEQRRGRFARPVVEGQRQRFPFAVAVVNGRAEYCRRPAAHRVCQSGGGPENRDRASDERGLFHVLFCVYFGDIGYLGVNLKSESPISSLTCTRKPNFPLVKSRPGSLQVSRTSQLSPFCKRCTKRPGAASIWMVYDFSLSPKPCSCLSRSYVLSASITLGYRYFLSSSNRS